ncbi:MAG: GtrA family protein [Loktanella sp.]|nr:GtrA family protein [Loktanella sp.]
MWAQLVRFACVGGIGFVVDGGLLWLLTAQSVNPYLARAISFPVAVVVTWLLNRAWSFRLARLSSRRGQFRRYFSVQVLGSLTNYAVYALWIASLGTAQVTVLTGFALGSAIGSILNFIGARYYAFRAHR